MEENTADKSAGGIILRGLAMGIAEVIPGVSGGTIAFITGIYERLIGAISSLSPKLIRTLFKEGFKPFWQAIDGNFLTLLVIGMFAGIGSGVFGISYLLENAPAPLWAFFFGLIAASVIYIFRQTDTTAGLNWVLLIATAVIAYLVTSISPLDGSTNLLYVFLSGAIAICAMILPGISGSFILLLLGMYTVIIPGLKNLLSDFSTDGMVLIGVFGLGCITGLLSFSKVLDYTFKNYKEKTLSILSGLMLGSLHKIWPWRNPTLVLDKTNGAEVPVSAYLADPLNEQFKLISEQNVFPTHYFADPMIFWAILACIIGFLLVILSMLLDKKGV